MKRKPVLSNYVAAVLVLAAVIAIFQSLSANAAGVSTPDIIVKISDLEKNLKILDQINGQDPDQAGASLSDQMRAFLHSTDWIDPGRSAVIGIELKEPQPSLVALIPFRQPSEAFQNSTNALPEKDFYLISFPPGQQVAVDGSFKSALNDASRSKTGSFVSVELALKQMMDKNEPQIRQMLSQLENLPQAEGAPPIPVSPQDIRELRQTSERIDDGHQKSAQYRSSAVYGDQYVTGLRLVLRPLSSCRAARLL